MIALKQVWGWGDLNVLDMKLTKDGYTILIGTKNLTEGYYRDKAGWLKVSARGRKFRLTAEQVLNHLLPAVAGIKPNLTITVKHRAARPATRRPAAQAGTAAKPRKSFAPIAGD